MTFSCNVYTTLNSKAESPKVYRSSFSSSRPSGSCATAQNEPIIELPATLECDSEPKLGGECGRALDEGRLDACEQSVERPGRRLLCGERLFREMPLPLTISRIAPIPSGFAELTLFDSRCCCWLLPHMLESLLSNSLLLARACLLPLAL